MTIQLVLGTAVIIIAIILMAMRIDSRVILLVSGLVMGFLALDPMAGFVGFREGLAQTSILEPIITSMGFASVMQLTGCDKHLVYGMLKMLQSKAAKAVLLPATMLVTVIINVALNSATATAASIGAIMIPVLVASGYSPATAAAAILLSTFGSVLNPGHSSNALVAKISDTTPVNVVSNQILAVVITFIAQAACLMIITYVTKANTYVDENKEFVDTSDLKEFKVNPLYAGTVFVPLLILVVGTQIPAFAEISVGDAMIIGSILALLITLKKPKEGMSSFWNGAGKGFTNTFSIVVCAKVFIAGMTAIGLIDALTNLFISNPSIAKISAVIGPAIMSIMTGTGTGMAVAFNEAVSANAAMFNMLPINMGSLVTMSSCMARALSPVAGVVILTAGLAKCDPIKVIKKQVPGFILSLLICAGIYLI